MATQIFQHKITIPLQDIDAAGIVFFAHLFRYAHEAYEQFMLSIGFSLVDILREKKYLIPLVHAEADYAMPLAHGDNISISLRVEKVGTSSFTLVYIFTDENKVERAVVKTVHVVLSAKDKKKTNVPAEWEQAMSHY